MRWNDGNWWSGFALGAILTALPFCLAIYHLCRCT